ncbi:hypothetical protein V2J88_13220 [Pseudomonas alliivorans]|nr:hypothetical protein [Pseudomonas alliivorans]
MTPTYEAGLQWEHGANVFSSTEFNDDRQVMRQVAARLIAPYGVAYYYGVIGKPSEKVAGGTESPNGKRQTLAAKALVVMSANHDSSQKNPFGLSIHPATRRAIFESSGHLVAQLFRQRNQSPFRQNAVREARASADA